MPVIPQPTIDFSDFLTQADTGDVVLWEGTSSISSGVEIISQSKYSHISMVITDPGTGEKCLLQSVSEELEPDPLKGGVKHSGVQAGALKATMVDVFNFKDYPSWRPYTSTKRGPAFDQAMWTLATSLAGTPFPDGAIAMAYLLIQGRYEGVAVPSPLFCSGLVATMLQKTGVLDTTMPPNGYFPKDFSSLYPGYVTLLEGSYGDDTIVNMPTS